MRGRGGCTGPSSYTSTTLKAVHSFSRRFFLLHISIQIQTSCPWVLRYLAAAAILSRKSSSSSRVRHSIRDIVKIVQTEEYQYHDPVTSFLKELYSDFDFEAAQKELKEAEKVVADDFFLIEFREDFMDNARYLISEAYCRIHQRIDIGDLSDRLNLSRDEGEKWIVNLIRETRMGADAKIDLEKNVITINRPPLPIYQSVIEKTRGLAFRTQAIGAAMGRSQQQQQSGFANGDIGGGDAVQQVEQPVVVEGAR